MAEKLSSKSANEILASLSPADLRLLGRLTPVGLPLRKRLEIRNRPIDTVYFLDSGVASVVANGAKGRPIEVGLFGRDGMSGLAVVMGNSRAPHDTFMQVAGVGHAVPAQTLILAMDKSASLRRVILQHCHVFVVQTTYTALANGRNKVEERLARWLLMVHDRMDGDELPLTHEFLAMMLGVRRPGITVALSLLERRALIHRGRGVIEVLDRPGLVELCNGAYQPTK